MIHYVVDLLFTASFEWLSNSKYFQVLDTLCNESSTFTREKSFKNHVVYGSLCCVPAIERTPQVSNDLAIRNVFNDWTLPMIESSTFTQEKMVQESCNL